MDSTDQGDSTALDPRRLLVVAGLVTAVMTTIMGYLVYTGNKMVTTYAPLVDAVMEIKLEATTGHLWFEELMAGDPYANIQTVWASLDSAEWYATAMLDGGRRDEGAYEALTDQNMRHEIEAVRDKLARFREIAEQRWKARDESIPGSHIDQRFDAVFEDFVEQGDRVETMLQQEIGEAMSGFRHTAAFLVGMVLILAMLTIFKLHQLETRRAHAFAELKHANRTISEQNRSLDQMAHYDSLTRLPNRTLFFDRLTQALAHAQRNRQSVSLLFIDLDQFKSVNDSFGHPLGDRLLEGVGRRLQRYVREEDTVARLSGDEFTVVLPYQNSAETALASASRVAAEIKDALTKPFSLGGNDLQVSSSIGIAVFPQDGQSADELVRNADAAMYFAKESGKNNYQFFSRNLNEEAKRRLHVETGLRKAIGNNELRLHYQPQYSANGAVLRGCEALIRWQHSEDGLIMPGSFISVAEASGLINPIGDWVISHACSQYRRWLDDGLDPGVLSLNLSAIQFAQRGLVETVAGAIETERLDPGCIELEITESVLMRDTERTLEMLTALKRIGVRLAIDDFGTGYSSMAYLRVFPIDTLKIDRTFVNDIEKDDTAAAIISTMIGLAHTRGLEVVAEGVETEEQRAFLEKENCELIQGYLFHRPMPGNEFETVMKHRNRRPAGANS